MIMINLIKQIIAKLEIKEVFFLNLLTISIAVYPDVPDLALDYD